MEVVAAKWTPIYQVNQLLKKKRLSTKSKMAGKMHTSRSSLNRLLDPENASVTLQTLARAAAVVGKKLDISLRDVAA